MSLKTIHVQNAMLTRLNRLGFHAHKILFGLLAQKPENDRLIVSVSPVELFKTIYPTSKKISVDFKINLEKALDELQAYEIDLSVPKSWKGFPRLESIGAISFDPASGQFVSEDPDTVIVPESENTYYLQGKLLVSIGMINGKVIARLNPIMYEFFNANVIPYSSVDLDTLGKLKTSLSPRVYEILLIIRAHKKKTFVWHLDGIGEKVPSMKDALSIDDKMQFSFFYRTKLVNTLNELKKLGFIEDHGKTYSKELHKHINGVSIEF